MLKRKSDIPLLTERPYTAQGFDRKFSNTNNLLKAKRGQDLRKGKKVKSPTGQSMKDLQKFKTKEALKAL